MDAHEEYERNGFVLRKDLPSVALKLRYADF